MISFNVATSFSDYAVNAANNIGKLTEIANKHPLKTVAVLSVTAGLAGTKAGEMIAPPLCRGAKLLKKKIHAWTAEASAQVINHPAALAAA